MFAKFGDCERVGDSEVIQNKRGSRRPEVNRPSMTGRFSKQNLPGVSLPLARPIIRGKRIKAFGGSKAELSDERTEDFRRGRADQLRLRESGLRGERSTNRKTSAMASPTA